MNEPVRSRAETTELVLAIAFTVVGDVLLVLGFWQLSYWLRGEASTLTIEPIVLPVGLVFAVAGMTKLVRVLRLRALATRGINAEAEVLEATPTGKMTDGQPWLKLRLRIHATGCAPAEVRVTWLTRPQDLIHLIVGKRVPVRVLRDRPHVVALR